MEALEPSKFETTAELDLFCYFRKGSNAWKTSLAITSN